ncbi:lysylphosphatidylglycerol synthase transmembrane domain-containing protein [Larsenimonas salina]|uniref:lysylphosphatidylglycerol synthase transmembrane domain-containing protein n=1 Tax=Larsenimonas salina TaxID=1295565 RepID=UPI0020746304|nr:lysylphosphatidylglycerol synthase transmembrane domain-containing protein [Larsenimonas salina]MCM5703315.1 flippase-like domain-containing protein [Larsenimonas salina]
MTRTLWLLGAGLLAILLVPLFLGGSGLFAQLQDFPLTLLLTMLGMIVVCWNLNALKLRILLKGRATDFGHVRAFGVVMASEFAICATPGGTGGPLTLISLLTRHGLRPAQTTAVFAVDQLIDLLFFLSSLIALSIYILIKAVDLQVGWLLGVPILLLTVGLSLLFLIARYHDRAIRFVAQCLVRFRIKPERRQRLNRRLLIFRDSLRETLKMPRMLLVSAFVVSVAHWLVRYSILYFTVIGLGKHLDWTWTFLVQMLSMAAGQLTLLPGGAGGTELSSSALLAPILGQSTTAAAILIWRGITYYFYLIAGAPIFLMLAGRPLLKRILRGKTSKDDFQELN